MNTSSNSIFLKEMGITEWAAREGVLAPVSTEVAAVNTTVELDSQPNNSITKIYQKTIRTSSNRSS